MDIISALIGQSLVGEGQGLAINFLTYDGLDVHRGKQTLQGCRPECLSHRG